MSKTWEQRKFSKIAERLSESAISDYDNPCVEYEDVIADSGELNKDIFSKNIEKKGIKFTSENVLYEEPSYEAPQESAYSEPVYEAPQVEESHYETPVENYSSYEQESSPHAVVEKIADELYQFEIPSNVAVLKKLISQLPSGVTRQTGAQIIKQTMEALGISMKSVLQDAQAIQEKLNNSAKDCQATIQEYKRQIATLEEQASSYKKQYNNLNDLVSLFIQH